MQDEEHRYDLCLADDSDKAASNVSLYLMMGCVPKKKIQHVFSESLDCRSAGTERLCGSLAVTIATLPRERLMVHCSDTS